MSRVLQIGEDLDQFLHVADVQMAGGMGQSGCADFDYDTHIYILTSTVMSFHTP